MIMWFFFFFKECLYFRDMYQIFLYETIWYLWFALKQFRNGGWEGLGSRTRWNMRGQLLELADGFMGDRYISTFFLYMFEFIHNNRQTMEIWYLSKCGLQTSNIKLQWQRIWKSVHSVVWLSAPILDSFQENATMVSINRKAQHFPPPPAELMLTSSPNESEGVETCRRKKRHSKNSPNAKGQKLPKNLLWSLLLFKLQVFFFKKDIRMLGWERTGKQQGQLSPEARTEDRMVHSLVCQGLDSSKDPTGIHVE